MFKYIIAARLAQHLSRVGHGLTSSQFGFRKGRKTVAAITRVRFLTEQVMVQDVAVLVASSDIANTFTFYSGGHQEGIKISQCVPLHEGYNPGLTVEQVVRLYEPE